VPEALPTDAARTKPTAAEIEALLANADAARRKPSRGLWVAAIVVSVVCMIALAYGLITYWDEPPTRTTLHANATSSGSGFGLGVAVGLGAGVVIGSLLAIRRRAS
jgi:hypothetical protein